MWKLAVLFAVLAVAAAEPGAILASPFIAPLTYTSTVLAPATTTITKQASSVVHPSPYLSYSSPYLAHFIKKRSTPLLAAPYIAPVTYTSPLLHAYAAPALLPTAPVVAHAPLAYTHLIKKRSAPLLTTPYIAPAFPYSAPVLHTKYTSPVVLPAAPIVSHLPLTYTHLIKRSAPLFTTPYIRAYTPLVHSSYSGHLIPAGKVYTSSLYRHPHVIKKRTLGLITGAVRWLFSSNQNNRGGGGGGGGRNNNRW